MKGRCIRHPDAVFVGKCPRCRIEEEERSHPSKTRNAVDLYIIEHGSEREKRGIVLIEEGPLPSERFWLPPQFSITPDKGSIDTEPKRIQRLRPMEKKIAELLDVRVIEPEGGDTFNFGVVLTNKTTAPVLDVHVWLKMTKGLEPVDPPIPYVALDNLSPGETREATYKLRAMQNVRGDLSLEIYGQSHEGEWLEPLGLRRSIAKTPTKEIGRLTRDEIQEMLEREPMRWWTNFVGIPEIIYDAIKCNYSSLQVFDEHCTSRENSFNGSLEIAGRGTRTSQIQESSSYTPYFVRVSVTGYRPPYDSRLLLEVYGHDRTFVRKHFADVQNMVRDLIEVHQAAMKVKRVDLKCEGCGAPIDFYSVRGSGNIVTCAFCETSNRLPSLMI
jgi:hypothetical protein